MAHVLIVEDSPTEAHALQRLLSQHGHQSTAVPTGEEGVAKAKELRPDLILMDVVMPGINGFQATRQLGRDPDTARIPVIVVSVKDQASDEAWALRQGAKAFIHKPYSTQELLAAVAQHLPAGH